MVDFIYLEFADNAIDSIELILCYPYRSTVDANEIPQILGKMFVALMTNEAAGIQER